MKVKTTRLTFDVDLISLADEISSLDYETIYEFLYMIDEQVGDIDFTAAVQRKFKKILDEFEED